MSIINEILKLFYDLYTGLSMVVFVITVYIYDVIEMIGYGSSFLIVGILIMIELARIKSAIECYDIAVMIKRFLDI